MNPTDYSQLPLRDIHLPGPVGWWPPAPGWWIVAAIVVGLAVVGWLKYRSRYRERAALRALGAIQRRLEGGASPVACIQGISMVLRRFAMSIAMGEPVAGLTGERWLRFLDSRWQRGEFVDGEGRILLFGPYAPPERVSLDDALALNTLCVDWIRSHKRPE
jgi:hypothetical protein